MLLIDGIKYEPWTPPNEDEFEQIVKEHAKDIFGEDSIYLDLKQKLKSKSGVSSIPDGYVIVFGDSPCWHIIEVELSSHPLYEHIVQQISKFVNAIRNPHTQREIADALYEEVNNDDLLKLKVRLVTSELRGLKATPQRHYRQPILEAIAEMGGQGRVKDILTRVKVKVVDKLNLKDYERLPSGEVRWENWAKWERKRMIQEGLLRDDSPIGVWEIAEKGWEWLRTKP